MKHRRTIDLGARIRAGAPAQASVQPPADRFRWTRLDERSFIAWPQGQGRGTRYCKLEPERHDGGNPNGLWSYTLHYDQRRMRGVGVTRQAAADAANAEWPAFATEIAVEVEVASAEDEFIAACIAIQADPALDIAALDLMHADGKLMLKAIKELGDGRVRVALSAEFYRRQTATRA